MFWCMWCHTTDKWLHLPTVVWMKCFMQYLIFKFKVISHYNTKQRNFLSFGLILIKNQHTNNEFEEKYVLKCTILTKVK